MDSEKEVTNSPPSLNSPPYQTAPELNPESPLIPEYEFQGDSKSLGHRLSTKESTFPQGVLAPGLESVWDQNEAEKEVVEAPPLPTAYKPPADGSTNRRRICGLTLFWFWLLMLGIFAVAIALGVGLGVGLAVKKHNSKHSSSKIQVDPRYAIGGAIEPQYYSSQGAFNGTGIAFASQSFSPSIQTTTHGIATVYFQYHDGTIRFLQLSADGEWLGGDSSTIVASDAKNSTPLSAVSYSVNGTSTWHLFYIDHLNQVKQRSNSNITNVWTDGPLNSAHLTAYDADQVGMQACWYGNDYGDSDYRHSPLPGEAGYSDKSQEIGMHLWYASNSTTFQQWGWRAGGEEWTYQESWTGKNGHAGVGCYSWGPGTVTYVMFVNAADTVEFWWKDTDTNLTSTRSHPINVWTNTSISIQNVHPSTSLGYTNYFYVQDASTNLLMGYNVSWAAERTSFVGEPFDVAGTPGLSGTHFSVSALPTLSNGNDLLVFFQRFGDDVSQYTRDLYGGVWSNVHVPIPEE